MPQPRDPQKIARKVQLDAHFSKMLDQQNLQTRRNVNNQVISQPAAPNRIANNTVRQTASNQNAINNLHQMNQIKQNTNQTGLPKSPSSGQMSKGEKEMIDYLNTSFTPQDQRNTRKIKALLTQPEFADMMIAAMSPRGTTKEVAEVLYKNKTTFGQFPSYHNKKKAQQYADEIVGLGVIQDILNESRLPGRDRITDIGFNGTFLTIETNVNKFTYGNRPGERKITSANVDAFIRKMSQQEVGSDTTFTKNTPLYNGSNDANYLRISATHQSLAPYGVTMSIRVASPYLALTKKNFNAWAPMEKRLNVYNLFRILVQCHCNIMISAETGAGKTELQKLLINFIPFEDRIVMIEDVNETHLKELYPDKDIFSWLTSKQITITDLVKQSLRNNPKWLIVAETRGAEAYEMFQGVKSDHSIITTLHSISNEAVPSRFIGMAEMGFKLNEEATERDFLRYMHIGVHITKKVFNGHVIRYCDEIAEFVPRSVNSTGTNILFKQHIRHDGIREFWTGRPSADLQEKIYLERDKELTKEEWPLIPKNTVREKLFDQNFKPLV